MKKFIELEEALDILDKNIKALQVEEVQLLKGINRILAENIYAEINNPPFNKSAMDGYAIKSIKENIEIKVIDKVFAGQICNSEVKEGEAVRIMTGAPIPKGANAVIKQEDVEVLDNGNIILTKEVKENENICFEGEDIEKGTLLISKNKKLDFADIGIIASTGIKTIKVYKKPSIAFISTGDEVIDVDSDIIPGKIFNSNKYTVISRMLELGYEVSIINHIRDMESEIQEYIDNTSKVVDLIITTGGVSVGEKDLLNDAIENLGGKRLFWKVKIKPGSAILCSIVNDKPIISLSGNPTAALTGFELFAKTTLEKMSGKEKVEIIREKATLCDDFNKNSPQRRFIRGRYIIEDGIQKVYLTQIKSGNGILSSNLNSNCMIEIEAGNKGIYSGDIIDIIKF